ncbi:MAG: TIGR02530 family flagellar biosynthesis protein [Candidatus Caldatribacteriaceae bacterium]
MVESIGDFRSPEITSENRTPLRKSTLRGKVEESAFEKVLQEEELQFSLHAQKRIRERALALDEETVASLQESVKVLESRGARNSLVVVGNTAFVVNVPHRVVVTCFDRAAGKENVFTNIDSAIIL